MLSNSGSPKIGVWGAVRQDLLHLLLDLVLGILETGLKWEDLFKVRYVV